jgi:hypothetical protein
MQRAHRGDEADAMALGAPDAGLRAQGLVVTKYLGRGGGHDDGDSTSVLDVDNTVATPP